MFLLDYFQDVINLHLHKGFTSVCPVHNNGNDQFAHIIARSVVNNGLISTPEVICSQIDCLTDKEGGFFIRNYYTDVLNIITLKKEKCNCGIHLKSEYLIFT